MNKKEIKEFRLRNYIKVVWDSMKLGTLKYERKETEQDIQKQKKLRNLLPKEIERPNKMHKGESYEKFRLRRKLSNTKRRQREKLRKHQVNILNI